MKQEAPDNPFRKRHPVAAEFTWMAAVVGGFGIDYKLAAVFGLKAMKIASAAVAFAAKYSMLCAMALKMFSIFAALAVGIAVPWALVAFGAVPLIRLMNPKAGHELTHSPLGRVIIPYKPVNWITNGMARFLGMVMQHKHG